MFVYKHTETIEFVKKRPTLRKIQTLRVNNSRILRIQNATFSGYHFYMNTNIWRDFQICISVPLKTCKKPLEDTGITRAQKFLFKVSLWYKTSTKFVQWAPTLYMILSDVSFAISTECPAIYIHISFLL